MERRTAHSIPTPERIREAFDYDPDTGILAWRIKSGSRAFPGKVAGTSDGRGYLILMLDNYLVRAHRVAFAHYYGKWPQGYIDHCNGQRSDNRICNLRDVSNAENLQNSWAPYKNNKTGLKGVKLDKRRGVFNASISVNRVAHWLGSYTTAEEAHSAYLDAKKSLHAVVISPI